MAKADNLLCIRYAVDTQRCRHITLHMSVYQTRRQQLVYLLKTSLRSITVLAASVLLLIVLLGTSTVMVLFAVYRIQIKVPGLHETQLKWVP
ncbi:hypothetical protein OWV82_019553 [Melia azedarach]|uniref:Uncharacterized protein n=1 Tax=Melia azedarach TaxID=155640 RepID=A0ACC1X2X1_MELAZ|nr:hypothetical protein OWV82_019553 [Melia azedarach]